MKTKPTLKDVWLIDDWTIDSLEGTYCARCGDAWERGQKAVDVPAPEIHPRAQVTLHLHCAVEGDEVEL
jgi:hypothetical protein